MSRLSSLGHNFSMPPDRAALLEEAVVCTLPGAGWPMACLSVQAAAYIALCCSLLPAASGVHIMCAHHAAGAGCLDSSLHVLAMAVVPALQELSWAQRHLHSYCKSISVRLRLSKQKVTWRLPWAPMQGGSKKKGGAAAHVNGDASCGDISSRVKL